MSIRKSGLFFVLIVGAALFLGYFAAGDAGPSPLFDAIFRRGIPESTAQNLVAATYLHYRLFDTLLEALLLLVSVIGVAQFARLSGSERVHPNQNVSQTPRSRHASHIMVGSLRPVYLFIALFGVYVILTGMDGPGGGFQGGAILAAIVISAHFAEGRQLLSIKLASKLEKLMYVLILATGMIFFISQRDWGYMQHRIYLTIVNVLVGVKVFAGLSMIYLYFMPEETEEPA